MKKLFFIILFVVSFQGIFAQDKELGFPMQYIIDGKDTIYFDEIQPAVKKYRPPKGKRNKGKEWREYYKLVHNFARTYPYALLAKEKIEEADHYMATHNLNKRQEEKFLKKFQNELFETFEEPLKNLTYTQGRILLRLIDREAGLTSFVIIKDYRGRAAAGFWQGVAKIFGADLKKPYDKFGEDKRLEDLVNIYQKGDFNYLYCSIFGKYPPRPAVDPKYDYAQTVNAPTRR